MANRYWRMSENMGYAGTESSETIDLCDYLDIPEEEVEKMTNEFVEKYLNEEAWQSAIAKVETWVKPIDRDEME